MKRGKKAERDTALWLNDDQESLLEEHKRRIKRREDHRRAEQERWREDKRRAEQERRREDKRRAEQERRQEDKRRAEQERRREEQQERRREEQRGEREWQEEQRREHERWKDQQRAVEIVDALSGLGEQRRRRYWTQRPTEQEITGFYEPDSNPLRREEQQRERKRQEEQQREWRRFSKLSEKAMNSKVRAHFLLPELNEKDIQLVGEWYHPLLSSLDRKLLIENHGEDRELGRLLSARSAEKIAMDFYQNQKYVREVKDISITQIKNNDPDWKEWKKYDLNVDGRPIDVKNSRQSPKSKDRYTEHCIPSFKRIERTNQEVRIAGVFSPYLSAFELLDKPTEDRGDAEILFLGETTLASLQELKREFKDLVENPSSIESPSSGYFLLPWVFDYPKYIYTEQDNARKELKDFSDFALLKESTLKFDLIPVGIAAGIDLMEILDNEDLDCWEWNFLDLLRNRIKNTDSHCLLYSLRY